MKTKLNKILKELEEHKADLENYFEQEEDGEVELDSGQAREIDGELAGVNFAITLVKKHLNKENS